MPTEAELQTIRNQVLELELNWFEAYLDYFFHTYFSTQVKPKPPSPLLPASDSEYARLMEENNADLEDRLIIMLAMAPHLQPQLLDIFFTKNSDFDRGFSEFGGIQGKKHSGFLPTMETALVLLAMDNTANRISHLHRFHPDYWLYTNSILEFDDGEPNEPQTTRPLTVSQSFVDLCTIGEERAPTFSANFPARLLETKLIWDDLVLDAYTEEQLLELEVWLNSGNQIFVDWNIDNRIKPGYRCLFFGPPGTGKTLTATLLGKRFSRQVYRVDLSMVVSKYIGETEKNLEKIFQQGENKDWVLFFDEADALFGKRTNVNDSHDRFANQEISYLLQRVEEYPGVVILATNLKANVDDAFARRFQAMIHFPMPSPEERKLLWANGFNGIDLHDGVDLVKIANDYEMSGGSIINVIRYAVLMATHSNRTEIISNDILKGIKRELLKEGKKY